MQVAELKHLIQQKDIPKFLIFTGDEYMVQRIYIQQIAKVKGLKIKHIDSITDIWATLNSRSFITENYLYVTQDDKALMTEEKIYSQIEDRLHDNMLILTLTSVDKRLKILKTYNKSLVEFEALKSDILKRYIQKEIALSDRNCEILMEICNYNYGQCLLEIDKIRCFQSYDESKELTADVVFKYLLEDGTIHVPPKDAIFDFTKAVLQNRAFSAYEYFQELKEKEEPVFIILTNLYNLARSVYQIQTCKSDNVAKSTGLNNWQIRNAKECVGRFSNEDLEYLMRLIQKVESGIKKGTMEEYIAVDYILANFM